MSVKRYRPSNRPIGSLMEEHAELGDFVRYSDYSSLSAEVERLRRDNGTMAGEARKGRAVHDTLRDEEFSVLDGRMQEYIAARAATDASGALGRAGK